jgi:arabinose-5-phosphate isomerase
MHSGEHIPQVADSVSLSDALVEMTRKGLGMTAVTTADGRLAGIFTDGDLRRVLDHRVDVHQAGIREVMTSGCKTARQGILAAEALQMMEEYKINALLVVDENDRLIGALNMHDLLRAGVV